MNTSIVLRKSVLLKAIAPCLAFATSSCRLEKTYHYSKAVSFEIPGVDDTDDLTPSYLIAYTNSLYYAPDDSDESMSNEGIDVIKGQLKARISWLNELAVSLDAHDIAKSVQLLGKEAELYTDFGAAIDGDDAKIDASTSYGKAFFNDIINNEELSEAFFEDQRLVTETWGDYKPVQSEMIAYLSSPFNDPEAFDDYAENFSLELESLTEVQEYLDANGWENVFDVQLGGYMGMVLTWYTQDLEGAVVAPAGMQAPAGDGLMLAAKKKSAKKKSAARKKKASAAKKKASVAKKKKARGGACLTLAQGLKLADSCSVPGAASKKKNKKPMTAEEVTQKHLKSKTSHIRPSSKVKIPSTKEIENEKNLLGKGTAGSVYKTKLKIGANEIDAAAKVVPSRNMDAKQTKQLMNLQKKVGPHPNVVGTLDVKRDTKNKKTVIVSELGGDSLAKKSGMHTDMKKGSKDVSRNMADTADGLAHMHKKGLYHGDVKPENIVTRPNGKAALIDWDGAKGQKKGVLAPKPQDINIADGSILSGGSPNYTAPELTKVKKDILNDIPKNKQPTREMMADGLKKRKIDGGKADVYSLGMTSTTQMLGHDKMVEYGKIKTDNDRASYLGKQGVPSKFGNTLVDMTREDPAKRIDMDQASKRLREYSLSPE